MAATHRRRRAAALRLAAIGAHINAKAPTPPPVAGRPTGNETNGPVDTGVEDPNRNHHTPAAPGVPANVAGSIAAGQEAVDQAIAIANGATPTVAQVTAATTAARRQARRQAQVPPVIPQVIDLANSATDAVSAINTLATNPTTAQLDRLLGPQVQQLWQQQGGQGQAPAIQLADIASLSPSQMHELERTPIRHGFAPSPASPNKVIASEPALLRLAGLQTQGRRQTRQALSHALSDVRRARHGRGKTAPRQTVQQILDALGSANTENDPRRTDPVFASSGPSKTGGAGLTGLLNRSVPLAKAVGAALAQGVAHPQGSPSGPSQQQRQTQRAVAELRQAIAGIPDMGNAQQIAPLVVKQAAKYGLDPSVLMAQIQAESGFTPGLTSSAGAQGETQFMPGTAAEYGVQLGNSPQDVRSQIRGQAQLMSDLLQSKGNISDALAAYNAGPAAPPSAAGSYPSDILGNADTFAALDKVKAQNLPNAPVSAQPAGPPTVQFKGQDVRLGGPYSGSRALVRLITGSPHLRGDHGGTAFGEPAGLHAPDGDHYRPDGYAQDINGDNPRENEPPFTQATMDTIVANLRALGARDSSGNPVPDLQIGEGGTYDVQGYTVYVEPVSSHIHVGAHPTDSSAPGSVSVSNAGIATPAAGSGITTAGITTGGVAAPGTALAPATGSSALERLRKRRNRGTPVTISPLEAPSFATTVPFPSQPTAATDAIAGDTARQAQVAAIMQRAGLL